MKDHKLHELLHQALETERGGIAVYRHAIACAQDEALTREWTQYLRQTERHEGVLLALFEQLGLDPEAPVDCRDVVIHIGSSLVQAMLLAMETDPAGAERVAAECVVHAETKDRLNWELLSLAAEELSGEAQEALLEACEAVEERRPPRPTFLRSARGVVPHQGQSSARPSAAGAPGPTRQTPNDSGVLAGAGPSPGRRCV